MGNAGKWGRMAKKRKIAVLVTAIAGIGIASAGICALQGANAKRASAQEIPVQEVKAETGTVSDTIVGTGNLECGEGTKVMIPSGITVDEVKAESGDRVSKGDVLAVVNKSSVLRAIEDVQEEIDDLDGEIDESKDDSGTQYIKSKVDGRVKKIYIQTGQDAAECMGIEGALMVLSMEDYVEAEEGADVEIEITAAEGQAEEIYVSEGDLVYAGSTLLKMKNDGQSLEFREQMAERQELAAKLQELIKLSENNAIKAEEDGIVTSVNIAADGDSQNTESAQGLQAVASIIGSVQGVRDALAAGSVQISRNIAAAVGGAQDFQGIPEAGEADSDSEGAEKQETCLNIEVTDSGSTNQQFLALEAPRTGNVPQASVHAEDGSYEGSVSWKPDDKKFQEETCYQACVELTAGEGYVFGADSISKVKTGVLSGVNVAEEGKKLSFYITYPFTEAGKKEDGDGNSGGNNGENGNNGGDGNSGGSNAGNGNNGGDGNSGGSGNNGGDGNSGGSGNGGGSNAGNGSGGADNISAGNGAAAGTGSSGTVTSVAGTAASTAVSQTGTAVSASAGQSDSSEDSDEEVTAFTISSADTMILSVNVDELDINSVSAGQQAEITLDAIEGEVFTGTVKKAANSASSSSGGVAKYTVEVEVPADGRMKEGMNASATITVEERENVVTLPVSALQERGNQVFVYTQSDSGGNLSGETEVTTGLSDGDLVEITEGLSDGETVYYQKRGNSGQDNFQGFGGMMGPGGDMGDLPQGGFPGGEFSGKPDGMPGNMPKGGIPGSQQ